MSEPLPDLQKWMYDALLHPEHAQPDQADARLTPNPRLSAAGSLAIYQQSYRLRIAACMREQFPALCHALGAELFNDFVAEYVREAPPESYTLYDLGRRFADFLEANRPDRDGARESWIDFIVDLTRFERAVFVSFDGPGAEDMPRATKDTLDSDLRANPSLSVGTYRFPVAPYYLSVRENKSPGPPQPLTTHVAVLRKDFSSLIVPLEGGECAFLAAMLDTGTVAGTSVDMPWKDTPEVKDKWLRAGFFVPADAS